MNCPRRLISSSPDYDVMSTLQRVGVMLKQSLSQYMSSMYVQLTRDVSPFVPRRRSARGAGEEGGGKGRKGTGRGDEVR